MHLQRYKIYSLSEDFFHLSLYRNLFKKILNPLAVIAILACIVAQSAQSAHNAPSAKPLSPTIIQNINNYLNNITELEADFLQIFDDGSLDTGRLYIKKPGRLRMEYAPPHNGLVIIGGGRIAIFDKFSDNIPEQFPIKNTPLLLLLRPDIDIASFIKTYHEQDNSIIAVLHFPQPKDNSASLNIWFSKETSKIMRWIVVNEQGEKVEIRLFNIIDTVSLGAADFNIIQEIKKRRLEH